MSSLPRLAVALVALFAVLLIAVLAWVGGELHYHNCLSKEQLNATTVSTKQVNYGGVYSGGSGEETDTSSSANPAKCSRLPW